MEYPPMEATAFEKWLNDEGVFRDYLRWQHNKTLRETWETCERGDWLEWLLDACGYVWPTPALDEYERVKAPALAEYKRVTAPALAEYKRVKASALDEYERVNASALDEYERVKASALAEYERVTGPARSEYARVTTPARSEYARVKADAIRKLIPYPFEKEGK